MDINPRNLINFFLILEKWKNRRKLITPTFHFQILEQFLEVFDSNNKILLNKLKKEIGMPSTDIYSYLKLYALDVICGKPLISDTEQFDN